MRTTDRIEPLDIKIGSAVNCRDGRAGRVIKLVVKPGSKRVTHIVVERGMLLYHDVVVPIKHVVGIKGDTVELDLDSRDLNALPEFKEIDFVVPDANWVEEHGHPPGGTLVDLRNTALNVGLLAPAWSGMVVEAHTHTGVPRRETPIGRGTRVSCGDEPIGHLDHVLLDPDTGEVRALVVRKGLLLSKDVIVPISWVKRIGEDDIVLDADRTLLESLPEYKPARSDTEIAADVQRALAADERTRDQKIDVRAEEGVVHLRGAVRTKEAKQAAAEAARQVPGVWEVEHAHLLADSEVAVAVRDAMARDPRTTQAVIDVICVGGTVTLSGHVRSAEEKAAAVEIARSVPGVVAVIDEIEIKVDATRKSWPAAALDSLRAAGLAGALTRSG